MDIHDKIIRSMCGEANNDVSYSSQPPYNDIFDTSSMA